MAFLPFYLASSTPVRVVILGGGYAGVAALVSLRRYAPDVDVAIIDPRPDHLKVTHLHETFRRPLERLKVPFANIERRFGCRHVQAEVWPAQDALSDWWANREVLIGDERIGFDAMLITCGAGNAAREARERVYDLADVAQKGGSAIMDELAAVGAGWVTIVGGGATGIQFLFEIADCIRERRLPLRLRLVDGEERVLKQFAEPLGRYVQARMADLGIEYLPETFFVAQEHGAVVLQHPGAVETFQSDSLATFLFPGKRPDPQFATNIFGQVSIDGHTLPGIFAAGDCARYRGPGSNTLTAQAAVRKGKLAARNILRSTGRLPALEPYLHRDLGYVISLGPDDAVGWLALERNVVAGYPALVVKELVEAQYDLLLAGIDTYLL